MRQLSILLMLLTLAACSQPTIRVGSKNFAENRILAEMFALLLEDAGFRVERTIPVGDTTSTFESLRSGGIDLYPEYTGTGLVLLGLPASPDPNQAFVVMTREFSKAGLTVLNRLGFQNTYTVLIREDLATAPGIASIHDLVGEAPELRIAVSEEFARRPHDGLQPFLDHFGLRFAEVIIVPPEERLQLYDLLLEGQADVIVGFQTDPQIADYNLRALSADDPFFPAYEAVPLITEAALSRAPEIGILLQKLAGRLDEQRMRALNRDVVFGGRSPRSVARAALAQLHLLPGSAAPAEPDIRAAIDPWEQRTPMTTKVLRAARQTLPDREVDLLKSVTPVAAVLRREARVALAPSIAQFRIVDGTAQLQPELETIAATGSVFVHALGRRNVTAGLAEARSIAGGPVGSPSYKLAQAIAAWRTPAPAVVSLPDTDAGTAAAAVAAGKADVALVIASLGRPDLVAALRLDGPVRLIPASRWWVGSARLALPFLSKARITAQAYPAVAEPVETLAMQATVVGPSPPATVIGRQGPSSYSEDTYPVTDAVVLAFNRHLGPHPDIGPHLHRAAALTPDRQRPERRLNPQPGQTVLSLAIVAYLGWCLWLLVRRHQD